MYRPAQHSYFKIVEFYCNQSITTTKYKRAGIYAKMNVDKDGIKDVVLADPPKSPLSGRLYTYLASSFFSSMAVARLLWQMIKIGPRQLFYLKKRTKRPAVLDDPNFGKHYFAQLKVNHYF